MRRLWQKVGVVLFWLGWPALALFLNGTERTRILITCHGRVVVVKGWLGNGKWNLPGGGLHKGEEPLAGLLREVAEEIGLVLLPERVRLLAVRPARSSGFRFRCHYYTVELDEQAPLRPRRFEITEVRWLDIAELQTENAAEVARVADSLLRPR
jgi:8-oxo-dGTP pyrophosphatase MutT (NUDIX family)